MTELRHQHCAFCECKLDKDVPGQPNTLDDAMRARCGRILCGPCVREFVWPNREGKGATTTTVYPPMFHGVVPTVW